MENDTSTSDPQQNEEKPSGRAAAMQVLPRQKMGDIEWLRNWEKSRRKQEEEQSDPVRPSTEALRNRFKLQKALLDAPSERARSELLEKHDAWKKEQLLQDDNDNASSTGLADSDVIPKSKVSNRAIVAHFVENNKELKAILDEIDKRYSDSTKKVIKVVSQEIESAEKNIKTANQISAAGTNALVGQVDGKVDDIRRMLEERQEDRKLRQMIERSLGIENPSTDDLLQHLSDSLRKSRATANPSGSGLVDVTMDGSTVSQHNSMKVDDIPSMITTKRSESLNGASVIQGEPRGANYHLQQVNDCNDSILNFDLVTEAGEPSIVPTCTSGELVQSAPKSIAPMPNPMDLGATSIHSNPMALGTVENSSDLTNKTTEGSVADEDHMPKENSAQLSTSAQSMGNAARTQSNGASVLTATTATEPQPTAASPSTSIAPKSLLGDDDSQTPTMDQSAPPTIAQTTQEKKPKTTMAPASTAAPSTSGEKVPPTKLTADRSAPQKNTSTPSIDPTRNIEGEVALVTERVDSKRRSIVDTQQSHPMHLAKTAIHRFADLAALHNTKHTGDYEGVLKAAAELVSMLPASSGEEALLAYLAEKGIWIDENDKIFPAGKIPSSKLNFPKLKRLLLQQAVTGFGDLLKCEQTKALSGTWILIVLFIERLSAHNSSASIFVQRQLFAEMIATQGRSKTLIRVKGFSAMASLIEDGHLPFEEVGVLLIAAMNDKKKASTVRLSSAKLLRSAMLKSEKAASNDVVIKIFKACIQALDVDASMDVRKEAKLVLFSIRDHYQNAMSSKFKKILDAVVPGSRVDKFIRNELVLDYGHNGQTNRSMHRQMANRQPNIHTKKRLPPARRNAKMTSEKENNVSANVARKSKIMARKRSA